MKLNEIKDNAGARKRKTRVGRGSSSGLGKTSGRGVKGQKARKGVAIHGFEGGQMPLYMRLPKRGFKNNFANDFAVVNLDRLQAAVEAGSLKEGEIITDQMLRDAGLAGRSRDGVLILWRGELKAKLTLKVAGAYKGAIDAVAKAGGSLETVFVKKEHTNKSGEPGKRQKRRQDSAEKRAKANAG
nr:MAG: 50S ribosomal protein L15 [Hyphomicrobiales bacterium]